MNRKISFLIEEPESALALLNIRFHQRRSESSVRILISLRKCEY